ncbi:MAG: rod shape-determining protein MreC [Candidatus Pacebacteria bacterium]|nr:rod shape-determining protein MreC [Candidatus Paceibacterota bacterium]
MSYHLDKKLKRKKYFRIFIFIILFVFIIYFQKGIFRILSVGANAVFRPFVTLGNNIGENFSNFGAYFRIKKNVYLDNENLRKELDEKNATLANYNSVLGENTKLKESLDRMGENKNDFVLSGILSKPRKSPFDTLVIDIGEKDGIAVGNLVFAKGGVPLGKIVEVYGNSSKVLLFSTAGEKTEVVVGGSDVYLEAIGRGGGNFEINVPRDFIIEDKAEAVLPGITAYTVAVFEKVISDPRDSFVKALFISPVNIQELKFVEVKK